MQVLVEQFLDYVFLERGLSNNTRMAYQADLTSFIEFLRTLSLRSFNEVKRIHILNYLLSEKDRGLSPSSLSRRLVSIKIFFRYLEQEGLLPANVTEVMDGLRLWKMLPETLTPREVERMLQAPDSDTLAGKRDRAILETFYGAGLRVSELATLNLNNLHMAEGFLLCVGKGKKERVVPLGKKSIEAIQEYLNYARPTYPGADESLFLFLTRLGSGFSRQGLWKLIKRYAQISGMKKNVTPHTLRHSFASHLLANGASLRMIQEMLGHADITTTQQYTRVDSGRLQAIHRQYHPRS